MVRYEKLELDPIKKQFSRTWKIFVAGWWKFLIISGLPYLAFVIIMAFFSKIVLSNGVAIENDPSIILEFIFPFAILIIVYGIFYLIAESGLIYSMDKADSITVKKAYRVGAGYALSMFWVMLLMGLVLSGGFILAVIPGIIFLIWYTFAPYVLIHKGLRGWEAFRESRELVRDYWWPVFGRLILFYVIIFTVQIQAKIMLPAVDSNIVAMVIQPLLNIFVTIYMFVIYQDLDAIKHPKITPPPRPRMSSPPPLPGS